MALLICRDDKTQQIKSSNHLFPQDVRLTEVHGSQFVASSMPNFSEHLKINKSHLKAESTQKIPFTMN